MPRPQAKTTYEYLQGQILRSKQETNLFSPETDFSVQLSDYWLFSTLYNLFGEDLMGEHKNAYSTAYNAITRHTPKKLHQKGEPNLLSPEKFQDFITSHIITITNNYSIHAPNGVKYKKEGLDAKLSRYACWSIMKQYPYMIFAQLYFMNPNTKFEQLNEMAYKFSRIYLRETLTKAEKVISGIAIRKKANMKLFNHARINAFFYNIDSKTLKEIHGIEIKDNDPIANYMGAESLLARQKALYMTIRQHDTKPSMSFSEFSDILLKALYNQRIKMIQTTGKYPEQDIEKQSVNEVKTELNKKEREFIKQFAFTKIR